MRQPNNKDIAMLYKKLSTACTIALLSLFVSYSAFAVTEPISFDVPLTKPMEMSHFTIMMPKNFRRTLDSVKPTSAEEKHNIHIYRYDGKILEHDLSITISSSKFKTDHKQMIDDMMAETLAYAYNTLYLKVPIKYRYLMRNNGIKDITINGIPNKQMVFTSQDGDEHLEGIILTNHHDDEANIIIATALVKQDRHDKASLQLLDRIMQTLKPRASKS